MLSYQDLRARGDIFKMLTGARDERCEHRALESSCADALAALEQMRALL